MALTLTASRWGQDKQGHRRSAAISNSQLSWEHVAKCLGIEKYMWHFCKTHACPDPVCKPAMTFETVRARRAAAGLSAQGAGQFSEPGFRYFSAQFLWKFCGESRRPSFSAVKCPKYRGDLRRRGIHAKTAQKNVEILAREIPYPRTI